jgi:hypothetical protein
MDAAQKLAVDTRACLDAFGRTGLSHVLRTSLTTFRRSGSVDNLTEVIIEALKSSPLMHAFQPWIDPIKRLPEGWYSTCPQPWSRHRRTLQRLPEWYSAGPHRASAGDVQNSFTLREDLWCYQYMIDTPSHTLHWESTMSFRYKKGEIDEARSMVVRSDLDGARHLLTNLLNSSSRASARELLIYLSWDQIGFCPQTFSLLREAVSLSPSSPAFACRLLHFCQRFRLLRHAIEIFESSSGRLGLIVCSWLAHQLLHDPGTRVSMPSDVSILYKATRVLATRGEIKEWCDNHQQLLNSRLATWITNIRDNWDTGSIVWLKNRLIGQTSNLPTWKLG